MYRKPVTVLALALALAAGAAGQVGSPMPPADIQDFAGVEATSIEDFKGRLLLIEFFAHW